MSSRNFGSKQFRGNREIGTVTHRLVVVAGVPPEVAGQFGTAFSKMASRELVKLTVLSSYRLDLSYTEDFVSRVYDKLVYKLREYASTPRESLLADTNVIVLFLQRSDGSDHILFEKFGVETLVTPMLVPNIADMPTDTRGQRGNVVNKLIREACLAIRHAKLMLCTIHEDLNGRENKTTKDLWSRVPASTAACVGCNYKQRGTDEICKELEDPRSGQERQVLCGAMGARLQVAIEGWAPPWVWPCLAGWSRAFMCHPRSAKVRSNLRSALSLRLPDTRWLGPPVSGLP